MQFFLNAVLIFIIFFLICLFGQFLRFLENKRDKRNLHKLIKECPNIQTIITGKVVDSEDVLDIHCTVGDENFVLTCLQKDFDGGLEGVVAYKTDTGYSFYKDKDAERIDVPNFRIEEKIETQVEIGMEEVVVPTKDKYPKKSKIRLVKTLGVSEYREMEPDEELSIKAESSDPEISSLIAREVEISQYEDSFSPNIFIDVAVSLGLTLFILIGVALIFF